MKSLFVLCLALLFPLNALAMCSESFEIRGGGWSKHFSSDPSGSKKRWNETHKGYGFVCNDKWGLLHFKNSWGSESTALLLETRKFYVFNDYIKFNFLYGVTTGYDELVDGGVMPLILPKLELTPPRTKFSLESTIVPGVVVTLNLKYKFR